MQQKLQIAKEVNHYLNEINDINHSDIIYLVTKILILNSDIDIEIIVDLYTDIEEGWKKIIIKIKTKEEDKDFDEHMKDQDLLFEQGRVDERLTKIFPHVIISLG